MLAACVLLTAPLACDKSAKTPAGDGSDTIVAGGVAGAADTAGGTRPDTACAQAGDWSECNLTARLESSGLAPRRAQGAIRQPFLSVPGYVLALGSAELQVYLYPDTLAVRRDFERLDTVRVAPPTMQISWRSTPHLIRSNNVMAILLSNDETQVERVQNAITAGLPTLRTP